MIAWTAVRMFLRGRRSPSRLAGTASENLLRAWAEGSRVQVERVTDDEGHELDPRDVDWTGMDPPPERRAGRPQTGRGRDGVQILIRVTPEERERIAAQAEAAGQSLAAYARDAVLVVTGRRERLDTQPEAPRGR